MRTVQVCVINVELVMPESTETRSQLQSDIMDVLVEKGYEVHSTEVMMVREKSMPDLKSND